MSLIFLSGVCSGVYSGEWPGLDGKNESLVIAMCIGVIIDRLVEFI